MTTPTLLALLAEAGYEPDAWYPALWQDRSSVDAPSVLVAGDRAQWDGPSAVLAAMMDAWLSAGGGRGG